MDLTFLFIVDAAACVTVYLKVYRSFKAPFFLILLAAALAISGASAALAISAWPAAEALSDLSLALFGAALAVASRQLAYSFMLAGERLD
jgi:hypothetical protein